MKGERPSERSTVWPVSPAIAGEWAPVGDDESGLPPGVQLVEVAVGLGHPERETALLSALTTAAPPPLAFVVAQRCLTADEVLACIRGERARAGLIAADLHRLTREVVAELRGLRRPIVLLVPEHLAHGSAGGWGESPEWLPAGSPRDNTIVALPLETPAERVVQALGCLVQGRRPPPEILEGEVEARDLQRGGWWESPPAVSAAGPEAAVPPPAPPSEHSSSERPSPETPLAGTS
ncbi:MAG TPA: hypothetical protein VHN78_07265, partial [Chloroflexota bacterium]|nr:hypothetical protein [Chloroflexota bacterium]